MPLLLAVARLPLVGDVLIRGANAFAGLATRLAIHHHERMTPAVRAGYLAPYDNWAHRIATLRFVQDIPHGPRHPSYPTLVEIEERLPLLADRPALIVWGMRDWVFTPAFLQQWLRIYPQADVRRLHDASHYVVEDAHERIAGWMRDFLADRRLAPT
jgi:haloalkane dehalogenase